MTPRPKISPTLLELQNAAPEGQVSQLFLQGMVNRMATSFHKYGHVKDNYPEPMDAIAALKDRLGMYLKTANTEWLMDVANYAMIEFMYPNASKFAVPPHFRATDSGESPGRIDTTGRRVK